MRVNGRSNQTERLLNGNVTTAFGNEKVIYDLSISGFSRMLRVEVSLVRKWKFQFRLFIIVVRNRCQNKN